MTIWRGFGLVAAIAMYASTASAQTAGSVRPGQPPRTSDGHSDLQGTWTNNTATPLARPRDFVNKYQFTKEEAAEYERTWVERWLKEMPEPDRDNAVDISEEWFDRSKVLPDRRTSLIVDPPNGLLPPAAKAVEARRTARPPANYDDPEARNMSERCMMAMGAGGTGVLAPLLPARFGMNFFRIVQTPAHVLIYGEMVHEVRIVRLDGSHLPEGIRQWYGDSVGRWEGDTLVVDTTGVNEKVQFRGSTGRLHVVERFTRTGPSTITYRATIDDPDTWQTPWSVELPFTAANERLFEYACHEANYSMELSLRGARAEEKGGRKP